MVLFPPFFQSKHLRHSEISLPNLRANYSFLGAESEAQNWDYRCGKFDALLQREFGLNQEFPTYQKARDSLSERLAEILAHLPLLGNSQSRSLQ